MIVSLLALSLIAFNTHQPSRAYEPLKLPNTVENLFHLGKTGGFKLQSQIRLVGQNSLMIDRQVRLAEYYSNDQKLAKVVFESVYVSDAILHRKEKQFVSYYKNGKHLVKVAKSLSDLYVNCEKTNWNQINEDLFGASSIKNAPELQAKYWFSDGLSDHFIGLGRLLVLIDAKRNELKPRQQVGRIRNHKTNEYVLTHQLATGSTVDIVVHIGENSLLWSNSSLPLRIYMRLPSDIEIVVDYSSIEPFSSNEDEESINNWVTIPNMFTIPLGLGCSTSMERFELFRSSQHEYKIVSFRAETEKVWFRDYPRQLSHTFVAYDGLARVMRTDTISKKLATTRGLVANGQMEYLITIHDLIATRKYHIRKQFSNADDTKQTIASIYRVNQAKEDCFSMQTIDSVFKPDPYDPVIPFDKLVEMGQATVRGTTTVAFEHVSDELPKIFFQHVTYRDYNNQLKSIFEPTYTEQKDTYSIVYFFAQTSKKSRQPESGSEHDSTKSPRDLLGPLMRLEVYLHQRLRYRVELHNFLWQLVDAPNGDSSNDLFSLGDRCSGDQTIGQIQQQTSSLSMELRCPKLQQLGYLKPDEMFRLVSVAGARNKAIVRSLGRLTSSISAPQIHSVESRIQMDNHQDEQSLMILVNAQLSQIRPLLFKPISVGMGQVVGIRYDSDARNFDECFWEAAKRRHQLNGGQLLFSFCYGFCTIDDRPVFDMVAKKLKLISTDVFTIDNNLELSCEVFRFDVQPDEELGNRTQSWPFIYHTLRDKLLSFPIVDVKLGQPNKEVVNLFFKVTQLELNNHKWWRAQHEQSESDGETGTKRIESNAAALEGVALSQKDNQNVVEIVGSDSSEMDAVTCRAHCVSRLYCRSYSICIVDQQVKCLISTYEFRDPKVLEQIESKSANLKRANKQGVIQVELPQEPTIEDKREKKPDSSQTTSADQQQQVIELRVQKRCRIHNKRALELFKQVKRESAARINKDLLGVADEEECAHLCLRSNAIYFRRMRRIREKQLSNRPADDSARDETEETRRRIADDMKFWCGSFRYMNLATRSSLAPDIIQSLGSQLRSSGGLCALTRPSWAPRSPSSKKPTTTPKTPSSQVPSETESTKFVTKMETFEFRYETLFERQAGIRLDYLVSSSNLSNGQTIATSNDQSVPLSEPANHQSVMEESDPEVCARNCFSQTVQYPWCRSFDLVQAKAFNQTNQPADQLPGAANNNTKERYFCVYNSMTLEEARQSKLADLLIKTETSATSISTTSKWWHFEPRDSYALDSIVLGNKNKKLVNLDEQKKQQLQLQQTPKRTEHRLQTVSIWLIALVGLSSGLFGGLKLADSLLAANYLVCHRDLSPSSPINGLICNDQVQEVHELNNNEMGSTTKS